MSRRRFQKNVPSAGGCHLSLKPSFNVYIFTSTGRGRLKVNSLSIRGMFFSHLTRPPAFPSPASPSTEGPDETRPINSPSWAGPAASFLFDSEICYSRSVTHFDVVGGLNLLDDPNPSPVPGGRPGRRDPSAPPGWLLPTEFSENCSASRDPFFPGKENDTEDQGVWKCCHPPSLCSEARQTGVAFNPFVSTERNLHFHLVCSESSIRGLVVSAQDKAADRRHRARHPRGGDEIRGSSASFVQGRTRGKAASRRRRPFPRSERPKSWTL